jgi:hypothetical protein
MQYRRQRLTLYSPKAIQYSPFQVGETKGFSRRL